MNNTIKKHIRLLAEKFNHSIEYVGNGLTIQNSINFIEISPVSESKSIFTYNVDGEKVKKSIDNSIIYDLLIDCITRTSSDALSLKNSTPITIDDWVNEEGVWAIDALNKLKKEIREGTISDKVLGGNRFEVEYYQGLLILTDDLCWGRSNVIEL